MLLIPQVLVLWAATLCAASPARLFFRGDQRNTPSLGTVATVDCSNREAVEFVSRTHANFRCVYPENRRRFTVVNSDDQAPPLFSSGFPAGLHSASLIRGDSSNCPRGQLYVPAIDMCLDAIRPLKAAPLESDNLLVDELPLEITAFSSDIQFASDCKSGQVYNSELSMCMSARPPSKKRRPLSALNLVKGDHKVPLEIQSFSSATQSEADCNRNEMWVSEIGACVNIHNRHPLRSASLIRSSPPSKINSAKDCAQGEVFVAEIGVCQYANPPKQLRPIVSDNQVKEIIPAAAILEETKCPPGEILVPSIDTCMPYNPPRSKPTPPSSSSLIKEPEKLEIVAFESSMSKEDCKPGQFYISELDICA